MPASGPQPAAEDLDHRALAGAVLADQRMDFARARGLKEASVEGMHAAEGCFDSRSLPFGTDRVPSFMRPAG